YSFTAPATPQLPPLSLHDALPISAMHVRRLQGGFELVTAERAQRAGAPQCPLGLIDHEPVPQRRILLGKRHVFAVSVAPRPPPGDRKSTRLNSSHDQISYAVFCLK